MARRLLSTQRIVNLSADPATGTAGEIYYNTVSNSFKYYNGTSWIELTSAGGGLQNVEEDTSPTLGGNLDAASFDITNIDNLGFDTTPDNAAGVGELVWDDGEGTLALGLKGGSINLQIGQENIALCYNGTGSTITKGSVVYISGAQGQRPSITLSDADTEAASSKTFGVVAENILDGAEGFVCTFGIVTGIDTSSFTAGQTLWLSSTAGQLTNVKPTQPAHAVFIGYCLSVNSSSGRIFVNPQNGYELQELHNVLINGIANNHILSYDNATSLWKNQSLYSAIEEIGDVAISGDLSLAENKILKIGGNPILSAAQYAGNAATVTNGLYSNVTYTDPSWLSTLSWSKITNTPTTLLGYGIVDIESTKQYLGLNNVENTALSTWAGSTNITTLGTIISGTWNGSVIADSYIASSVARLAGPTFTGTVVLPGTTSIGEVTSTEISYLDGVTSAIQTQINNKLDSTTASSTYAPINSPTFTGTVTLTSATVVGLVGIPSQTNNSGKYLTTDGSNPSWATLNALKYSATEPVSPAVGDIWVESDVDVTALDPKQYLRWTKVLTGSQSLFSGISPGGVYLEYVAGTEQVYLNGILLLRGTDYTATDGLTVILSTAASSGDVFEVVSLNSLNVVNMYTSTQIDNLLSSKSNIDSPTFTGTPSAPTAIAGTNTTQIATTAFVRTEVSNLIASAPAALDTLDELAAALGDDANFATTVTNSLAAKAPLASPSFTGTLSAESATFTGTLDVQEIRETINDVTLSSNAGTFDWATGNIFFIGTAPSANMTFNLTNVPTDNGKIMSVTVFVTQGSTGYIPSTLNINGSSATIKWVNGTNPVPTSQAGKIDIFAFSLIRRGSAWTVLGSSSLNF